MDITFENVYTFLPTDKKEEKRDINIMLDNEGMTFCVSEKKINIAQISLNKHQTQLLKKALKISFK